MFDQSRIKLNEVVWRDRRYAHPVSGQTIPRDFYDRSVESEAIRRELAEDTGRLVVMIGGRRSGKTSLVKHLGATLSDRSGAIGFVEVPWGGIQSWEVMTSEILHAIRSYIGHRLGKQESVESLPLVTPGKNRDFVAAMKELLSIVPERRWVLAIDEFDSILEGAGDSDDAGEVARIVHLIDSLVAESALNVSVLVTMAHKHELFWHSSQAARQATTVTLRPFPRMDMDAMIVDILGDDHPVSQSDLDRIYALSGGWPYFAKLILTGLAGLPPSPDQVERALGIAVENESEAHRIVNIYDVHFDDDEKRLVLLLAENGGQIAPAGMALLGAAIQTAARQLGDRDYVDLSSDGGCRLRVAFLGPWLRNWVRYDLEVDRRIDDLLHLLERDGEQPGSRGATSSPGRSQARVDYPS